MSKTIKVKLLTAGILMSVGLIIFAVAMTLNDWDFTKLNTVKYETNTYELNKQFYDIHIQSDTADVTFKPTEDDICKVVCYEKTNAKHTVTVKNNTLSINENDERKWYDYIGINIDRSKITVYLSEKEYKELSITTDTGDTKIPKDFSFTNVDIKTSTGDVKNNANASGTIKIKTSTGDIRTQNITVGSLELSASTGDITLKSVIAMERFSVETSTGDVKLEACDGREILVKTSTGDVKGSLLSDKVFFAESNTGDVNVPKTTKGGKCEIVTDTGDIRITIDQ